MRYIKNIFCYLMIITSFMVACKENNFLSPIDDDSTVPSAILNPTVENLPGAAKITYALPDDPNLLYVKAEFDRNGEKVEVKSSFYKNYVVVEGFGDTEERIVKLYSVSRAEKLSPPVEVTIKPEEPAIFYVLQSLVVKESFGGLVVEYSNPSKANIVIKVQRWEATDAIQEWVPVDNHYTGLEAGKFSVRGQEAVLKTFGILVTDRWNNTTAIREFPLTPIYEEQLDKSIITYAKGRGYPVPQLQPMPKSGGPIVEPGNLSSWPFPRLFDGQTGNTGFHTNERQDMPIWIPMDLGVTAKLSRYKFYQRNSGTNCGFCYSHGNCHEWEMWGTNTPTDVNSWVLLDHQILEKPSGLPLGTTSNDDKAAADAGHEYELDINSPAVRYVAWKHIDNWGAIEGTTGFLHIAELNFWGQIQ